MSLLTTGAAGILSPEEVAQLVVEPLSQKSVCLQTSTVVPLASGTLRVPIVTADVSAAWTQEGEEISPSLPGIDEIDIVPAKLASITPVSTELAEDSSPEATALVMDSVTRDLQLKIDAAWLGNAIQYGPSGLLSVGTATPIPSGGFVNLDPFYEAQSEAEALGATITAWITSPATALQLAQLKVATDWNQPLLVTGADSTGKPQRTIGGVPVWVSRGCSAGVVWGIDKSRVITAMRRDVDVRVSDQAYFTSDRLAVRATLRCSFGFPHGASIMRIGSGS